MQILLGFLLRTFTFCVSSFLGDNLLRFVAGKVLLTGVFVIILPLVLNNFIYDIINIAITTINSNSQTSFNGAMSFSGLTSYIIFTLRVPDCLSVIVSALVLRVTLNHIPFVRV